MRRDKDLKRLVRSRMKKTGEAYTAARAQVTGRTRSGSRSSAEVAGAAASAPDVQQYAEVAGQSDATMKAKTGCNWERWVRTLDHHTKLFTERNAWTTMIHGIGPGGSKTRIETRW